MARFHRPLWLCRGGLGNLDSLDLGAAQPGLLWGGGRLTNCRNAVPDAERKKSRAASVSSARLSRSRVAPWVFGRETTEKRQRRWVGWLHGWLAGSRTARFQTCVGAALSASPTNSEQILQAAHHASPAAAQLNRCSSTPLPLSSPLVRRRLHHRSSLIALPRLGPSSSSSSTTYAPIPHPPTHPFRRLAGHHPRWASLRRPKRPGQRRSSSPERNLARST